METVRSACRHLTAADVHTFFVIDRSSSMGSTSCTPDNERGIRELPGFDEDLENVLGVVYEAAYKYMWARAQNAPHDLVTFLPFNDRAEVKFLAEPISESRNLMTRMLKVDPHKGTKFGEAFKLMHATLQQVCTCAIYIVIDSSFFASTVSCVLCCSMCMVSPRCQPWNRRWLILYVVVSG